MILWIIIGILAISLLARAVGFWADQCRNTDRSDGCCQTTGNREVQADAMTVLTTAAGKLAVLADGIGKENTGKVCANLAVRDFTEAFSIYKTLHNPEYFLERTMYRVHMDMQKTLEERNGGASVGVVLIADEKLYYALAGQIKIALLRGEELILLSEGQTISVLAKRAYEKGKLARQETIRSMDDNNLWNYVGKDGFCRMEVCEVPVRLKQGDLAVMMTKGIFEEVSFALMEKILTNKSRTLQERAERIVRMAEKSISQDKENGSVMVLWTDGKTG